VTASWYGPGFQGHRTASGERFDPQAFTAAARSLPLGARVRVTNLTNGRSTVVRINDRGPYVRGRSLDLSYASARAIGMVGRGTAPVRVEPVDGRPARSAKPGTRRKRKRRR
jgi:rare lipoprotein A